LPFDNFKAQSLCPQRQLLSGRCSEGISSCQKNRWVDFDRLKLAQALAILKLSRPALFKELSMEPLLDLINQQNSTDKQIDPLLHKLPKRQEMLFLTNSIN